MSQKRYAYFSAAIRDGAKLKPQSMTGINRATTCAVGAGVDAMGMLERVLSTASPTSESHDLMIERFPYLKSRVMCPDRDCPYSTFLFNLIWHVNDEHGWTREAIADWLYAEEEKLGFITIDTEASSELSLQTADVASPGFIAALN